LQPPMAAADAVKWTLIDADDGVVYVGGDGAGGDNHDGGIVDGEVWATWRMVVEGEVWATVEIMAVLVVMPMMAAWWMVKCR